MSVSIDCGIYLNQLRIFKMMLLDLLLELEKMGTDAERETFCVGLYKTNRKFADLCDLAYRRGMISRYANGEAFPEYTQDNVPYGYNFAQLEIIGNKLKVAGFTEHNSNRGLPDHIATKKLIQVFESLSDVECKFVKYILRKDIPYFNRDAWIRAKHEL